MLIYLLKSSPLCSTAFPYYVLAIHLGTFLLISQVSLPCDHLDPALPFLEYPPLLLPFSFAPPSKNLYWCNFWQFPCLQNLEFTFRRLLTRYMWHPLWHLLRECYPVFLNLDGGGQYNYHSLFIPYFLNDDFFEHFSSLLGNLGYHKFTSTITT